MIVDGNLEHRPVRDDLDRLIRDQGADLLGVTVMPGPQLADAELTVPRLKAAPSQAHDHLGRLLPDPALGRVPPRTG